MYLSLCKKNNQCHDLKLHYIQWPRYFVTKVDGTINAAKYVEILDSCLWPVIARHFPDDNYCFQDDNAPVHRARLTKTFTDENKIKAMEWPAQSPDLNHWKCMAENENWVAEISKTVDSRDQLYDKIFKKWTNISVNYIRNLYSSIPKRIRKVQTAQGYITKY